MWTWATPRARVIAKTRASADAVTLQLQANAHWQGCLAGQHVLVQAQIDGRYITRAYSPTELDAPRKRLAITVKQVPGGRMSGHLCEQVQVGDVLGLGSGFGEMRCPAPDDGPWIWLAAGSGITPMMGMLHALGRQGRLPHIALLTWDRMRNQQAFDAPLQSLRLQHPQLQVHRWLTGEGQSAASAAPEPQGQRLNAALLEATLGPLASLHAHRVYACGPTGFVAAARSLLAPHVSQFVAEDQVSRLTQLGADMVVAPTVEVTLLKSAKQLALPTDRPLLQALEEAGLKPAFGCRMGVCHTCVCTRAQGSTQDLLNGSHDSEPGRGLRLCVSRATSDLSLDL